MDTFQWKHPLSGINGSVLLCVIISHNKHYIISFTQSSGLLPVSIMTFLAEAKSFMHRCECAHTGPQDIPSLHTNLSFFPLFPLAMCDSRLHLFGPALIFLLPSASTLSVWQSPTFWREHKILKVRVYWCKNDSLSCISSDCTKVLFRKLSTAASLA